jgi:hypothetical protein
VPEEAPGFAADIRPLFRDDDVYAMEYSFNLASYADVRVNAEAILTRVEDGSMPCDVMWSQEQVEVFRLWLDMGMAP